MGAVSTTNWHGPAARALLVAVMIAATGLLKSAPLPRPAQSPVEELFNRAQSAAHQNHYAEAEKLYRQVLQSDPNLLPAQVNLGLACYWQHKDRDAVTAFQKALASNPHQFTALLFSGLAEMDLAQYVTAHRNLLTAMRVRDTDPLLFWALGSLAMMRGNTNTAVTYLERSVAMDPNNVRSVWLLGEAYTKLAYDDDEHPDVPNDYKDLAQRALQWIEQQKPNSAMAHVFKGDILRARKLTPESLAEYQKAQAIDPNWPDIHLLIGSLDALLSRWDDAVRELKLQLKTQPGDPRTLTEMGVVYIRSGKYSLARPYLEQAVKADPQSYRARYRLGDVYVELGQYALAIPQLESAARINPSKTEPLYLLYRAYRGSHENEKATAALREFQKRQTPAR